ncbi:MAG: GAF domain-containing protein, partial [Gloeobacteraceae cyanobacterium ES-bin-316]|nr:GAF domain-containing protein [Ferruginibacter sp.]
MHQNNSFLPAGLMEIIIRNTDGPSLMQAIYEHLQPFFNAANTSLQIIHEKESVYDDLERMYPAIYKTADVSDSPGYRQPYKNSPVAYQVEQLRKKKRPTIFTIEKHPAAFSELALAENYKESYAALLAIGNGSVALLNFNSKQNGAFKWVDAAVLQQMADLIAICLSNILIKETLQKETEIKETLLAISKSIASIQNRKELFATIFQKIAPVIPIDDTAIVILNEDRTEWKDLSNIDHYHESIASKTLQQQGFDGYNQMDDFVIKSLTETGIVTIDELLPNKQIFAPAMYEAGLREFMFTPMICQGKTIGSLFFDSKKYGTYSPKYFELFKAIAEMIAVAVTNILAKEEIEEREKEKTKLLAISEAISKSRNATELLTTIR